jgi:hypothetical protein
MVLETKTKFTVDDVRHYRYPWMLLTTVNAYGNVNTWQKAGALLWIEEALSRPLTAAEFESQDWLMAEVLFALRQVMSVVEVSGSDPVARSARGEFFAHSRGRPNASSGGLDITPESGMLSMKKEMDGRAAQRSTSIPARTRDRSAFASRE